MKHGHASGHRRTSTYLSWQDMKKRCNNPTNPYYEIYGGRGITVCQRWESFINFLEDMGEKPKGLTLERVDNNKGYFPENCKWATPAEQTRNRKKTIWISFRGRTMCATDWATELGFKPNTLIRRLLNGWPHEKALTTPVHVRLA